MRTRGMQIQYCTRNVQYRQDQDYRASQDSDIPDSDDEPSKGEEDEDDEPFDFDFKAEAVTQVSFIDVEWSDNQQEIIEFGCIRVWLKTLKVVQTEQYFIKPFAQVLSQPSKIRRGEVESLYLTFDQHHHSSKSGKKSSIV